MNDPRKALFLPEYAAEEPPEYFLREVAKLELQGRRFSPIDYGEQLASYVGTTIRLCPAEAKKTIQSFKQKFDMGLAIRRLTGDFYYPEEAAILLHYARNLADLRYDLEGNEFLIRISTVLKPPSLERIDKEVGTSLHRIRFSIRRPGRFWRKYYFLSYTMDLAIYRQLSRIACGHPLRLPGSSDWFWPRIRRLAEKGPMHNGLTTNMREELYELEADVRALWLLKITKPRPFSGANIRNEYKP